MPITSDEDQFHTYARISHNYSHSFLFESLTGPENLAETSIMGFDPPVILRGYADHVEITHRDGTRQDIPADDPLVELKKILGHNTNCTYRYMGGAVGFVNYDYVRLVERLPGKSDSATPVLEFGIYDDGIVYDHVSKRNFYFYYNANRLDRLQVSEMRPGAFEASGIQASMDEEGFTDMINRAKRYIHAGDIFQVVLSRRFCFKTAGDHMALYRTLRDVNPSPYMYHLKHDTRAVIGASPEMLTRVTGNTVETFPIAGTAPVTGDPRQDDMQARRLLEDQKELAEHTMLVDLGRNDIGRVCKYGTVRPAELMRIKKFSHVQHIVTHLTGELDGNKDMFDAFRAVFPAGTVSGAPKIRAMEIIDELETEPRGIYAGAVGYFSFNGCCDFAIAIRSIFIDGPDGHVQSGAGIVADSVPQREFGETQHKADAMLEALRRTAS